MPKKKIDYDGILIDIYDGILTDIMEGFMSLMQNKNEQQVVENLLALRDFLRSRNNRKV